MEQKSLSKEEQHKIKILTLRQELEQAILKVNFHFHSGYEKKDERLPVSIFMNFLKKGVATIHSAYLMRLKNRDVHLIIDEDFFITNVRFTDLHWSSWDKLSMLISDLNEAARELDYDDLRSRTNTIDKFYQLADKDIDFLRSFKFS